jgi:hypothetical protein
MISSPLPKRAAVIAAACILLTGCTMTPEDKAFYGRGWINPDELDREPAPPHSYTDPISIQPRAIEPGDN